MFSFDMFWMDDPFDVTTLLMLFHLRQGCLFEKHFFFVTLLLRQTFKNNNKKGEMYGRHIQ